MCKYESATMLSNENKTDHKKQTNKKNLRKACCVYQ